MTQLVSNQTRTRKIKVGDKYISVRRVLVSSETKESLGYRSKRVIVSKFPVNPLHIEKQIARKKADIMRSIPLMSKEEKDKFMKSKPLDFVEDKTGYRLYDIFCVTCSEKVATVWSKDESLKDWVDLHYICSYDQVEWSGCMAVSVSPIDGSLGFECVCGEDTRDFRVKKGMPPIQKQLMIEYSLKHREFNTLNSRFIAIKQKGNN